MSEVLGILYADVYSGYIVKILDEDRYIRGDIDGLATGSVKLARLYVSEKDALYSAEFYLSQYDIHFKTEKDLLDRIEILKVRKVNQLEILS